ncbi:DUF4304 domain-containing protein [Neobacillus niacini]|uniref:DUF4304 domain-containing protein n=1 Tax=Neobacillus niacini TaxID=86668 RepID=UPI0007AC00F9|nr:DUF4304 domain-containing protein [Neobacillus niacini]
MEMNQVTKEYGYRKKGNSFWKIENGFYKLINIQKSNNGDYFFINLGIHPVGLPQLITGQLNILEKPPESGCIFRKRIEQVAPSLTNSFKEMMSKGLTTKITDEILTSIPYVEEWMKESGTNKFVVENEGDTLTNLINVVPILGGKAYLMIKFFCNLNLENKERAYKYFQDYLSLDVVVDNKILDFTLVDSYLKSLMKEDFPS